MDGEFQARPRRRLRLVATRHLKLSRPLLSPIDRLEMCSKSSLSMTIIFGFICGI
jgi:hypothetical protein